MSSLKEEAQTRIASLIESAACDDDYGTNRWHAHFIGWRAQVISALEVLAGKNHVYTTEFKEYVTSQSDDIETGINILRRLHSDIEKGYLQPTAALA